MPAFIQIRTRMGADFSISVSCTRIGTTETNDLNILRWLKQRSTLL